MIPKFLILILIILVVVIALLVKCSFVERNIGRGIIGGGSTEYVAVLMVEAPLELREMQRKYIPHVTMPSHLTLAYLDPKIADDTSWIKRLKKIPVNNITFNHLKVTKTFAGLIPCDIKKLEGLTDAFGKYVKHGPRGGYHMSVAYNPKSKPLSKYALKEIREKVTTRPFTVNTTSVKIMKRKNYQDWIPYKTIIL